MLLRDYPLMSYRGIRNWPPAWTWINSRDDKQPRGEIGILTMAFLSTMQPANRCFLLISYEESSYMGCLLFDDATFCKHIGDLLQFCRNPSIDWEYRSLLSFVSFCHVSRVDLRAGSYRTL
jgi:hypothetical protein